MWRVTALVLLSAAFFWGAAAAQQNGPGDQDWDLDLIPQAAVATRPESAAAAKAMSTTAGRVYIEDAFTVTSPRGQLAVAAPGRAPFHRQERLFVDIRKEWRLAGFPTFTYSGRVNFRAEDGLSFPAHENLINEVREAYMSWHPSDRAYFDLGRINLKSGVALGYNPTDFFRSRSVVEPLSADPTVLREDRLGTLMLRGQQLFATGSLTLAFAPDLYEPSPIYTDTGLPSLNPMLDRTNASNRFLAKGTLNLDDRLSPELLLYRERNHTRFGTNLAEGIGQKVVTYLEWSGGRRATLIDDALRHGRDTGTLPVGTSRVTPGSSRMSFQSELALGASYTTESRVTFNLEYHFNQAGFAAADWRNWFAMGRNRSSSSPVAGELWYLRAYAADQQYPISRHSAFLRADWVDAFVPRLELTGFVNVDLYDGSGLVQLTADDYLSDHWTVGALTSANFGSARSNFGSLGSAASFMVKVARYF
jgi:hypothetical protein